MDGNTIPVEIRPASVILEAAGARRGFSNDYVWIFTGGVPPNDFLKRIGVEFGARDVTIASAREAALPGGA